MAEATSIRNRLRERKKKESQRQRRAHASAMTAHAELQSAQLRGDADALREAVDSADAYTDALPGLEAEVNSARARALSNWHSKRLSRPCSWKLLPYPLRHLASQSF